MRVIIGLLLCVTLVLYVAPVGGKKFSKRCKPLVFKDTTSVCDQAPNREGRYRDGTICMFDCREGCVKDTGNRRRVCKVRGRSKWWIGGRGLKCDCNPCKRAPSHPEGSTSACGPDQAPFLAGHVCNFTCLAGYTKTSGGGRLLCQNGQWRGSDIVCQEDCDPPQMPPNTIRGGCDAPYTHWEVCNYECTPGFIEYGGDNMLTCKDGVWVGEELDCNAVLPPCPAPPGPQNTIVSGCTAPLYVGDICSYECGPHFLPEGVVWEAECIWLNGAAGWQWLGAPANCRAGLNCGPAPMPPCAILGGCAPPYTHWEVCNYNCDPLAVPKCTKVGGDDTLTCNDGNWDGEELVCKEDCGEPPHPECTIRGGCFPPYNHFEQCWYNCNPFLCTEDGGDRVLTCNDGNWDGVPLICKKDCDDPPGLACAIQNGCNAPFRHNDVCIFGCEAMCTKDGGDEVLTCDDGNWVGNHLICKEDCTPQSPANTIQSGCDDPTKHGDICNYDCIAGFMYAGGDYYLTCNDGDWDGTPLVCDEMTTPAMPFVWG